MVAEGFIPINMWYIPIEARAGHRLASVSVTGDFSNKRHLVLPERSLVGMKDWNIEIHNVCIYLYIYKKKLLKISLIFCRF